MRILGLDISTKTVGISCLDFNKSKCKIIYLDHFHPPKEVLEEKEQDFLNMLSETKKHIMGLIEEYKPDYIAVEDYIRFIKGSSSSFTVIPLAILNRTICLAVKENYPSIPLYICNIISIRTMIKKAMKLESFPDKLDIPNYLEKLLKIKLPAILKKNSKMADPYYDRADSIAVGYYCKNIVENQ